jgi:hypothetical protein
MRERLLDATVGVLIEYERRHQPRVWWKRQGSQGLSFITSRPGKAWSSPPSITLARQRAQTAIGTIADARSTPDPAVAVLDLLWEAHQGPMFVATVELWVAARTNPVLLQESSGSNPRQRHPGRSRRAGAS